MGQIKTVKKMSPCALNEDRLSSLPKEMKSYILSLLNVEEAVRASVLSKTWRDMWTTMPQILLFDSSFGSSKAEFITLVDLALSLHEGPLVSFSIEGMRDYQDVFYRWMYMLSRKKPRDVKIKLLSLEYNTIPSSLYSISDLEHLNLQGCIVSLPQMFEGFKQLKFLKLKHFSLVDSGIINCLISSCPLLNTLVLKNFDGICCLNIRAQVLRILKIKGSFEELHLDTPNLVHADLIYDETEAEELVPLEPDVKSYFKQAFGSLNCIKTLTVSHTFLMYLSMGCMLMNLPAGVFDHLERISIKGCLSLRIEVVAACALFQSASNLRVLDIWGESHVRGFRPKRIWEEDYSDIQAPALDHLVTVTLHGFKGLDCEIGFLERLLGWAPALEEVKVGTPETVTDQCLVEAMKKLLSLQRASAKAKIIFV